MKKRRNKVVKSFACLAVVVILLSILPLAVFADMNEPAYTDVYGDGTYAQFAPSGTAPTPQDFRNTFDSLGYGYILSLDLAFYFEEEQTGTNLVIWFYSFAGNYFGNEQYNCYSINASDATSPVIVRQYYGNTLVGTDEISLSQSSYIFCGYDHFTITTGDSDAFYYCRVSYTVAQQFALSRVSSDSFTDGYEEGYRTASDLNYESAYNSGYYTGFGDGEGSGYSIGYDDGFIAGADGDPIGYEVGYQAGYSAGSVSAVDNSTSWDNFLFSALNAPVRVLRNMFTVEVFGISMWSLFVSLFLIAVVIFVVKVVTK